MLKANPEKIYQNDSKEIYIPKRVISIDSNKDNKILQNNNTEINPTKENNKIIQNNSDSKQDNINPNQDNNEIIDLDESTIDPNIRVPTGLEGFDHLIGGGFEKNSTVLVVGSAGTGKTILSLQFLYKGITEFNENGVFISFEEDKHSLYKHAKQFGWDFKKLEDEGKFRLISFKPHQVTKILEEGGGQIRDSLIEINAKRVVVDSITAYSLLFNDEYKRREKVLEFFNLLSKWKITSIIVAEESAKEIEGTKGSLAFISDAVISLYYHHDEEKGIRTNSLEVIKMRGTKHTNKVCAINFESDGIRVYPDVEVF